MTIDRQIAESFQPEVKELEDLARQLLRALVAARAEAEDARGCVVRWEDQAVIPWARKVLGK